ncbi:hypothetical protein C7S18_15810 [Ahniella affigens]|uniref:Uncharacterized protein n=1 Tax=Ahniella affigens TaxID=2021234 RepID=A0A2P1PUQ4_9GAMM|nr:hypothetical protein [Ahniella affigens]AVP98561.1 hypothetical protein C7S18_15810 [Ahniella affigens]
MSRSLLQALGVLVASTAFGSSTAEESAAYEERIELTTSSADTSRLTPLAKPAADWRCGSLQLVVADQRKTTIVYGNKEFVFALSDLASEVRWQAAAWFTDRSDDVLTLKIVHARLVPITGSWTLNVIAEATRTQVPGVRRYRGQSTIVYMPITKRQEAKMLRETVRDFVRAVTVGENAYCRGNTDSHLSNESK